MTANATQQDYAAESNPALALDPVCGMKVDPAKAAHHADYAGQTYHLCSAECRTKFIGNR